ncbi:hypothetical protein Q3G72_028148 [Acer saccharum]|nr:hypothetical protein Q3G72_028148 [Acer saccharum]
MIFGVSSLGGSSNRARKAYARKTVQPMQELGIFNIEQRPEKVPKLHSEPISFNEGDALVVPLDGIGKASNASGSYTTIRSIS